MSIKPFPLPLSLPVHRSSIPFPPPALGLVMEMERLKHCSKCGTKALNWANIGIFVRDVFDVQLFESGFIVKHSNQLNNIHYSIIYSAVVLLLRRTARL